MRRITSITTMKWVRDEDGVYRMRVEQVVMNTSEPGEDNRPFIPDLTHLQRPTPSAGRGTSVPVRRFADVGAIEAPISIDIDDGPTIELMP